MKYEYKAPEKLDLDDFVDDFIPNFDGINSESEQSFQTIEAWASTYCVPPNFPYNPATCIPIM